MQLRSMHSLLATYTPTLVLSKLEDRASIFSIHGYGSHRHSPPPPRHPTSRPLEAQPHQENYQPRRRRPPPGPPGLAASRQPLPDHPPAPPLDVRRPRPPHPLRAHLHPPHGPAHHDCRHQRRPHPRGPRPEGPPLRQPAIRLPHPPHLQRWQVHRQLRRVRPPLALPAPQLRLRDRQPLPRQRLRVRACVNDTLFYSSMCVFEVTYPTVVAGGFETGPSATTWPASDWSSRGTARWR